MSALAKFKTSLNRPRSRSSTPSSSLSVRSRESSVDALQVIGIRRPRERESEGDSNGDGSSEVFAVRNVKRLKTLANDICRLHDLPEDSLDDFVDVSRRLSYIFALLIMRLAG
jgi:hypothetical protein